MVKYAGILVDVCFGLTQPLILIQYLNIYSVSRAFPLASILQVIDWFMPHHLWPWHISWCNRHHHCIYFRLDTIVLAQATNLTIARSWCGRVVRSLKRTALGKLRLYYRSTCALKRRPFLCSAVAPQRTVLEFVKYQVRVFACSAISFVFNTSNNLPAMYRYMHCMFRISVDIHKQARRWLFLKFELMTSLFHL